MLLIGLSGKKHSGKTTCAASIVLYFGGIFSGLLEAKDYAFGDLLKETCMGLFGLTHEQCYGTDADKNSVTKIRWKDCNLSENDPIWDKAGWRKYLTAREVLQVFGTNIIRTMNQDAWTNATLGRIRGKNPDIAVITDVRFPNEVKAILDAGGYVIRLTRNVCPSDSHVSETALDFFHWPQGCTILYNSAMTLEEQRDAIETIAWNLFRGPIKDFFQEGNRPTL